MASGKTLASTLSIACLLVLGLALGATAGCGGDEATSATPVAASSAIADGSATATEVPSRLFSPSSFWNTVVAPDAPLDPSSAKIMHPFRTMIAAEKQAGEEPSLNTSRWSIPIYQVGPNQPTIRVALDDAAKSPALQAAWHAVPLPSNAKPAAGTDRHLVVWQPSTNRLWEFWRLAHGVHGWHAAWGGAMERESTNQGVYGPYAWPGATRAWGASASSLSIAGGLITLDDLAQGQIDHAMAIAIPDVRAGVYSLPAHRTDGTTSSPLALPEGAHLRLDPKLDLSSLHLPPLTLKIAEAAQRYGVFVRSRAGHVVFYGQDPTPTGTDPYLGPQGYFGGRTAGGILASFPWGHLQLLKMSLH